MAYDENVAQRVRDAIGPRPDVNEIRMFGGLAFVRNGNMAVGVMGAELMVRMGPEHYEEALALPHARLMDFTGKPLRGFVYVAAPGFDRDVDLDGWVTRGMEFAGSLPPKEGKSIPRNGPRSNGSSRRETRRRRPR